MMRYLYLLLSLWCLSHLVQAQTPEKEELLAAQYVSAGEYEKAVEVYKKLLANKPDDIYVYENLLKCLLLVNNHSEAEKLALRMQKKNRENPSFTVDAGYIQSSKGNKAEATKIYDDLLKKLKPDETYADLLSRAFEKRGEYHYAAETLLKYRKITKINRVFSAQLAQLLGKLGREEEMIEEYLNILSEDDSELDEIKGFLQAYYAEKQNGPDGFKKLLMKRMQEESQKPVFPDLLVWLLTENKEYEGAFVQCRALDKRFRYNGRKLFEWGEQLKENEEFTYAIKAYMAVLEQGNENPYAVSARYGIVEVRRLKIFSGKYTKSDLFLLESDYLSNISLLGVNYLSANFIRDLAHLQAFYLNKHDSAVLLLKQLTSMPRLSPMLQAEAKLELADVLVLMNDVWEATLLYEQVDYDFKEEPIGQLAKFKNATLSYYRGDFEWAQAQLDVLKTATTQLISNNSIELSLLIQDNTGLDSTEEAMKIYALADLLNYQQQTDSALLVLALLEKKFPEHSLADEVLYLKGKIFLNKKEYKSALGFFTEIYTKYPTDILADNALLESIRIYDSRLNDKAKALELCDKFINSYTGSMYVNEVRIKFRQLRGEKFAP
ncbi:MAG: tetratricopeptide repeat protein [Bacteroidia bacterium]